MSFAHSQTLYAVFYSCAMYSLFKFKSTTVKLYTIEYKPRTTLQHYTLLNIKRNRGNISIEVNNGQGQGNQIRLFESATHPAKTADFRKTNTHHKTDKAPCGQYNLHEITLWISYRERVRYKTRILYYFISYRETYFTEDDESDRALDINLHYNIVEQRTVI